jgi:uncharacterized protein YjbJ (UPF0337 family)
MARMQAPSYVLAMHKESPAMDENRAARSIEELKGTAKDAIGWVVRDAKLQSDGETDNAVGEIQNYGSGLNDAVRDAEAMKSAGLLVASSIGRDGGL